MTHSKVQRNSSIELLRIIAILGVIILHYNGIGFNSVKKGSVNHFYMFLTENIFVCSVNVFIIISAYFLCMTEKRNIMKVVELIFQTILFRIIIYIISVLNGNNIFSIKDFAYQLLPVNYFVILYCALYIISPYINIIFKNLSKKEFQKLLIIAISLFSIWTFLVDVLENISGCKFAGLSTVGIEGSQSGYTIVNFILLYLVGAYIKIHNINIHKNKLKLIILFINVILYISSISEFILGFPLVRTWSYNNPLLIIMASVIVMYFIQTDINSKIINELARSTFTCYLIHRFFLDYILINKSVNSNIWYLITHQIICAVIIYLISYLIYKCYSLCTNFIFTKSSV